MQIGQTTEEEGVDGEIQKRPNCKSKEIESQAVLNRKVSNIKTFCLVGMRVGEEKQVQYKNFLGNCNTTLVSTKTSSKSDMSGTGLK